MEMVTELKRYREAAGQTVTGMARKLRIGVSRYYMIESGERPATPEIAKKISEILGVQQGDIFLPQSFTVRKSTAGLDEKATAAAESADGYGR